MSIQAMTWALSLPLEPSAKITLIAVANYADDNGICFPKQSTLSQDCCQSIGTIKRRLRDLDELGLTRRRPRWRTEDGRINYERIGRQTSDEIHVDLSLTPDQLKARAKKGNCVWVQLDTPGESYIADTPGESPVESPRESSADSPINPYSNLESTPLPPTPVQADKPNGLSAGEDGKTEPKTETPKPVSRFYTRFSREGSAIRVIAALRGETDVPSYWQGQDPNRRAGYWVPFELTPRLVGLGQIEEAGPIKHHNWSKWPNGSNEAGSWRALLKSIGLKPPEGAFVRAPWPFPPRADGSLSVSEDATGPPVVPPMTEGEKREFAGG